MRVGKIIKRVADKKLVEAGFQARGSEYYGPCTWLYERQWGGEKQELIVQKVIHYDEITVHFGLIFSPMDIVDVAHEFSPEFVQLAQRNESKYVQYRSEDELSMILTELTDVAIMKLLPFYEALFRRYEDPSAALEKRLYDEVLLYSERFVQKYDMPYETEVSKIKKNIKRLEQIIDENRHLPMEELQECLLGVSAYYGELIRNAHDGEWIWKEDVTYLKFVQTNESRENSNETILKCPLVCAFSNFHKPELYCETLSADYKDLLWGLKIENRYEID